MTNNWKFPMPKKVQKSVFLFDFDSKQAFTRKMSKKSEESKKREKKRKKMKEKIVLFKNVLFEHFQQKMSEKLFFCFLF